MLRSSVFHKCQWVSTNPGATIIPCASISAAPGAASPGPTAAIWLPWTSTSPSAKSPSAGSMVSTWPCRMTIPPSGQSFRTPQMVFAGRDAW